MEQEQNPRRAVVADFVEQRLGLAPERDQSLVAKPCEMLRQGGLAEADSRRQFTDRHLLVGDQMAEDKQPVLISEHLHQRGGFARVRGHVGRGDGDHLIHKQFLI